MKAIQSASAFFDKFASSYDENMESAPYKEFLAHIAHTLDVFVKKPSIILDAGTGTGYWLEKLHKKGKVVGVDFSKNMLEKARERMRDIKSVELISSDVKSLPFKNNYFDYAVSIEVLRHMPKSDILIALKEFSRVLKPNGILIVTMINPLGMRLTKLIQTYFLIPFLRNIRFTFNPKTIMVNPYDTPITSSNFEKITKKFGFTTIKIVKPWKNSLTMFFLRKLLNLQTVSEKWSYKYIVVMKKNAVGVS